MTEPQKSLSQPTMTTTKPKIAKPCHQREITNPEAPENNNQEKNPKKRDGKPPEALKKGSNKSLTREFTGTSIRSLEGEGNERKFILSFSSEEPYDRGWCVEVLDHSPGCIDLTRINDLGVLLFNHKRDSVLGKINRAWLEGNRGCAEVEFDNDDEAEVIYQKVQSGTLKAVSVGYRIESVEEVMAGKTSADGRFTGPCYIARKWAPYEISIVSVPADSTVGVGREFEPINEPNEKRAPSLRERQLQINFNNL